MVKTFSFSYNRPAQLDLLIRSWREYFTGKLSVSYAYSDDKFKSGYEIIRGRYPEVKMIDRVNLKQELLEEMDSECFLFMCDDDVFVRKTLRRPLKSNQDILCYSLRMGRKHTDYLDEKDIMRIPIIDDGGMWEWRGQDRDWGCPMTTTGNLYRTDDIKPMIFQYDFEIPSQLEPQMQSHPINKPYMICDNEASVYSLPVNQVQTMFNNKNAGLSVGVLNDRFLNGEQINLKSVVEQLKGVNSCFAYVNFEWEKR